MRKDAASNTAEHLGARLVEHVAAQDVIDTVLLRQDPAGALKADASVEVRWVEPAALPTGCSIAASYQASRTPARIVVARDASDGRRRFSVLHEYAHHLRNQVTEVLEALFQMSDGGARLEERMCDEFAAQVLLPRHEITKVLGEGVCARAVLDLIATSSASAQACAVAAARHLATPGYVLLLGHDGTVLFAARSGDTLPVTRGTRQEGLLARAAIGLALRGRTQVTYATGNSGPEMFVDTATADGRRVAVLVTDSPPWSDLTLAGTTYEPASPGLCEHCDREFVSYDAPCRSCREKVCPDCGRCACSPLPTRNERRCASCSLTLPPAAFTSVKNSVCRDCA